MNKKEAIEFIKTRWPKFLEEQGLTNDQYKETCKLERFKKNEIKFENISKAKTPKQLKQIVGIDFGVRRALNEENILLSEKEINKLVAQIATKSGLEDEEEYDAPSVRDFYKPGYFSRDTFLMITKNPWYMLSKEYYYMKMDLDNYDRIDSKKEIEFDSILMDLLRRDSLK